MNQVDTEVSEATVIEAEVPLTAEQEAEREGVSVRTIYKRRAKSRRERGEPPARVTYQSHAQDRAPSSVNPLIEALNARIAAQESEIHFLRSQVTTFMALPAPQRATQGTSPRRVWPWIAGAVVVVLAGVGVTVWQLGWVG